LPASVLENAINAASKCDTFISIGTSTLVQPAASLPLIAIKAGATLIEVNPQQTPITSLVHHSFSSSAGNILPALVEAVW
jgi:NAD-dependent deacetylase